MDSGKVLGSLCSGRPLPEGAKDGFCLEVDASVSPSRSIARHAHGVSARPSPVFSKSDPRETGLESSSDFGSGISSPHGAGVPVSFASVILEDDASGSVSAGVPDPGLAPIERGSSPRSFHSASTAKPSCPDALCHALGPLFPRSGDGEASPRANALPSSTPRLSKNPVCPVRDVCPERTGSPSSAPYAAPPVPDTIFLPLHSNFELDSSNFPPIQPISASKKHSPHSKAFRDASSELDGSKSAVSEPDGSKVPFRSDWASLLKVSPPSMKLKFIKPECSSIEGKLTIKLPSSVALEGSSIWKNTLVGFFLDNLPFSLVQSSAMKHWGKLGLQDVLSNGNGFYFFNFPDLDSLSAALEGGPWHFGGRPIFLKRWSPCMNLSKEGCRKVPIWAQFYNVPLELWTEDGLSYIASMVGLPLHADKMTASLRRLSFARICIEIDIHDTLPDSFDIELEDGSVAGIHIVYNWIPKKCSICKVFGHHSSKCMKAGHQVWVPKSDPSISEPLREKDRMTLDSTRVAEPGKSSLSSKAKLVSVPVMSAVRNHDVLPKLGFQPSANPFDALRSVEDLKVVSLHAVCEDEISVGWDPRPVADPSVSGLGVPGAVADPLAVAASPIVTLGDPNVADGLSGNGVVVPLDSGDQSTVVEPIASPSASPVRIATVCQLPCSDGSALKSKDLPANFITHSEVTSICLEKAPAVEAPLLGRRVGKEVLVDPVSLPVICSASIPAAKGAAAVGSKVKDFLYGSEHAFSPPSNASTPLLARRIKLVDELEKKLGKQPNAKKKNRRSSSSRGTSSLHLDD